jgi:hypothetical protein
MAPASPPAGYSGTPLATKLGVRPGIALALAGAVPPGFLGNTLELPDGVVVLSARSRATAHLALLFVVHRSELAARLRPLLGRLPPDGACWVAWPKRASKVATDMDENVVREVALPLGVVDNKVAAIDAVWSGLRLVVRLENRSSWPSSLEPG